jgi:sugar lactone lactonase YvrE
MNHSPHHDIQFTLLETLPCQNMLGEGVQWNSLDHSLWWTDIQAATLFRYHPETKILNQWPTPERVGCFAFAESDPRLLVAFATGIAWWDWRSGEYEWLARPELAITGNRLNDGRVDRQGRFWVGSIVEQSENNTQSAALYCLNTDGNLSRHLTGLTISNSLCWSPDSRRLYHADSPSHCITIYDFDTEQGGLSNPALFAQVNDSIEPDGACVDAAGYLWSAQWGGGRVVRYTPAGAVDTVLTLPVSQPTCVAFGGPNLDWLCITSARQGLTENQLNTQPLAGSVFIYQVNIMGLPECRFKA